MSITVTHERVAIRMEEDRWVMSRTVEDNRGGTIRLFIDHHFGKEDDFTGEVVNYEYLPEPIRFEVVSEEENEQHHEEYADYNRFTPKTAETITGLPVETVVNEMIARWNALKLIVTPDIAAR